MAAEILRALQARAVAAAFWPIATVRTVCLHRQESIHAHQPRPKDTLMRFRIGPDQGSATGARGVGPKTCSGVLQPFRASAAVGGSNAYRATRPPIDLQKKMNRSRWIVAPVLAITVALDGLAGPSPAKSETSATPVTPSAPYPTEGPLAPPPTPGPPLAPPTAFQTPGPPAQAPTPGPPAAPPTPGPPAAQPAPQDRRTIG